MVLNRIWPRDFLQLSKEPSRESSSNMNFAENEMTACLPAWVVEKIKYKTKFFINHFARAAA